MCVQPQINRIYKFVKEQFLNLDLLKEKSVGYNEIWTYIWKRKTITVNIRIQMRVTRVTNESLLILMVNDLRVKILSMAQTNDSVILTICEIQNVWVRRTQIIVI